MTDLTKIVIDTLPMVKLRELGQEFGVTGRKNDLINGLRAIAFSQEKAK